VGKLVEDMEKRRVVASDLFDQQILNLGLELASKEVRLVQESLAAAVSFILEQYRDVIKYLVEKYRA
jgi:hypothetical protein